MQPHLNVSGKFLSGKLTIEGHGPPESINHNPAVVAVLEMLFDLPAGLVGKILVEVIG